MKRLFSIIYAFSCLIATHPFAQNALSDSSRKLTFAERVSYQRAIEAVYWRHRIWPKENLSPKPPLDAVMSKPQLENNVREYLRNSQALENDSGRPITPEQLQAEMERMAQQTKQPEVLRELFAALGNDPFVIAECLARPVLAERMISDSHVTQTKIGLSTPKVMAAAAAHYSLPKILGGDNRCTDDTWTPTSMTNAPSGRFLHTAVWTGTEMIIWGGAFYDGTNYHYDIIGGRYNPVTDSWIATSTLNAPTGRYDQTAVWTGTEMIVWGGFRDNGSSFETLDTGGRYNPSTDSWMPTSTSNVPTARWVHTAVWTGTEMIVWGGIDQHFGFLNTGGRYNPSSDTWTASSITDAPTARSAHAAVWTGSQMIVWGGGQQNNSANTGGRYNPSTDSWTATSTTNVTTSRYFPTAVWTGREMIAWGGYNDAAMSLNTGGIYNPDTDSWTATRKNNAPTHGEFHTAVWTGSEMIVWSGFGGTFANTGGRYNPRTDSWTRTSTTNAPAGRWKHTAVWTGSQMIVWGGTDEGNYFNSGGRYCAQTAPPITLSAAKRKMEGINTVYLTWSGGSSSKIDIYRCDRQGDTGYECNPIPIVTTANDGVYSDSTGDTGRASYKYRACEAGTSICSNTAEVPK